MTNQDRQAERKTKTITFWVAVNQDGDHYIDEDSAKDAADYRGGEAIRVVQVNLEVELPVVETVNVAVVVPVMQAPAEFTARVV